MSLDTDEYSEAFRSALDSVIERERILDGKTPLERLEADLYEFTAEEIEALLGSTGDVAAMKALHFARSGEGDLHDAANIYLALIFTVGVEIGRELERRVK